MGKLREIAAVLAGTLFLSLASGQAPQFIVEGEVYCEVCRTNFINKLSELMAGN